MCGPDEKVGSVDVDGKNVSLKALGENFVADRCTIGFPDTSDMICLVTSLEFVRI